jgi:hypothetical protein
MWLIFLFIEAFTDCVTLTNFSYIEQFSCHCMCQDSQAAHQNPQMGHDETFQKLALTNRRFSSQHDETMRRNWRWPCTANAADCLETDSGSTHSGNDQRRPVAALLTEATHTLLGYLNEWAAAGCVVTGPVKWGAGMAPHCGRSNRLVIGLGELGSGIE